MPYASAQGVSLPDATPCGLGEVLPAGFRLPSELESTGRVVEALHALYAPGGEIVPLMVPPLQASSAALVGAVESTAGVSLGRLLAGGLLPGKAAGVQIMLADILNAAAGAIVNAASSDMAGAVGSALEIIPVVGGIASGLFGTVTGIFEAVAALEATAEEQLGDELNVWCSQLVEAGRTAATSAGGPTPADQFRRVAYAYQLGERLPLCVASMYVMLCGAETGGFGFPSRRAYEQFVNKLRVSGSPTPPGIPADTQRRMWKLIKGIMAAVQNPGLGELPHQTDQGRSLMPILQETVRQHWVERRLGGKGVLPAGFLQALSDQITGQYAKHVTLCFGGGKSCYTARGSCADGYVTLVPALEKSIRNWECALESRYYDPVRRRWTLTPVGVQLRRAPEFGVLVVDRAAAEAIARRVERAYVTAAPPPLTPLQGLAVGTGAVGIAYGAYTAMRRWGPRPA